MANAELMHLRHSKIWHNFNIFGA